jgi:hypothetical protein
MYTNLQSVQPFGETGRFTADLLCALFDGYVSIRALFGKFGAFIITCITVMFLRVMLWWLIKVLEKDFNTNFEVTPNNYTALKSTQIKLGNKIKHLAPIKQVNITRASFLVRGMLNQIKRILTILENYHATLSTRLSDLDNITTSDKKFKVITEAELWAKRTKHYAYRF